MRGGFFHEPRLHSTNDFQNFFAKENLLRREAVHFEELTLPPSCVLSFRVCTFSWLTSHVTIPPTPTQRNDCPSSRTCDMHASL